MRYVATLAFLAISTLPAMAVDNCREPMGFFERNGCAQAGFRSFNEGGEIASNSVGSTVSVGPGPAPDVPSTPSTPTTPDKPDHPGGGGGGHHGDGGHRGGRDHHGPSGGRRHVGVSLLDFGSHRRLHGTEDPVRDSRPDGSHPQDRARAPQRPRGDDSGRSPRRR